MEKVGRNTPVFYNEKTGEAVCGKTLNAALGVGISYTPSRDWKQVTTLPKEKRVCIQGGSVLPHNVYNTAVANTAKQAGQVHIVVGTRQYSVKIKYVDATKIIYEERE